MTYKITLRITAPSKDHLQCAIAAGLLTETFLNAANGENDVTEWIHSEGHIKFERLSVKNGVRKEGMTRWFRFQNDYWRASIDIEAQEAKAARELLNKLVGAPADWTLELEITHQTINGTERTQP